MVEPRQTASASGTHLESAFLEFVEPCHVFRNQQEEDNQGLAGQVVEVGEALSVPPARKPPEVPRNQEEPPHTPRIPHILVLRTLHIQAPHTPRRLVPHNQVARVLRIRGAQAPHSQAGHQGEPPQSRSPRPRWSPVARPDRCSRRCNPGRGPRPKTTANGIVITMDSWDGDLPWGGSSRTQYSALSTCDQNGLLEWRLTLGWQ